MKKIVALVLSLVMVLGLATTAFAAVPLWGASTTVEYDEFDAKANTYTGTTQEYTYYPAKAPVLDKDGNCVTVGQIAHWVNETNSAAYVMVDTYSPYAAFAVKAAKPGIALGDQTTADALYFMIPVLAVEYGYTATAFTAFADGCGNYSAPVGYNAVTDVYGTVVNGDNAGNIYKMVAAAGNHISNILIDGKLYNATTEVTANKHAWTVTEYTDKGVIVSCKCVVCDVKGSWVESVYLAPAAAKVDQAFGGYVYYGVAAPEAGDKVESAETFDAGIAMYVGMSVMAAAGSAVVLKKKD